MGITVSESEEGSISNYMYVSKKHRLNDFDAIDKIISGYSSTGLINKM